MPASFYRLTVPHLILLLMTSESSMRQSWPCTSLLKVTSTDSAGYWWHPCHPAAAGDWDWGSSRAAFHEEEPWGGTWVTIELDALKPQDVNKIMADAGPCTMSWLRRTRRSPTSTGPSRSRRAPQWSLCTFWGKSSWDDVLRAETPSSPWRLTWTPWEIRRPAWKTAWGRWRPTMPCRWSRPSGSSCTWSQS